MQRTAPFPDPEPLSEDDLKAWTLSQIQAPAVTPDDYRLRAILNDLLTEWEDQS
ncbi:hypothetical protein Q0Z83_059770 [Actinoplanes sichuanensis]|uniref:Uncharacterized protein n=1 Tax=Actinoplanes sichuanensis TaxID=512349 RepID=A0ABW4A7V1_9ACTN|nr:hypothetical protein [Actinoplanes sichuanensis]BEL07786.1 hypothetical protein Q0Z83_059770 [Actinoplanes sichuanensis]